MLHLGVQPAGAGVAQPDPVRVARAVWIGGRNGDVHGPEVLNLVGAAIGPFAAAGSLDANDRRHANLQKRTWGQYT